MMKTEMEQSPAINPNPVLSVAKNGTVLYSNEAGEPLLREWGIEVREKLPSNIGDIVQRVISLNNPEKIEVKAGKKVYLIVFHPLSEEECVNISGFDISDQKELEEKLRESEEKYRDIIETSIEGIWILDAEFRTSYVNKKMAEILGYNQEEMIDRFPWDFADEEVKNIIKLNMEKRRQSISEILQIKYIRSDGSPLWSQVSSKSLFDENGKFTGVLGMLTDITERKQAEVALRESEERYRELFESSLDGIIITDLAGNILKVNPAFEKMLGYSTEELQHLSYQQLTPARWHESEERIVREQIFEHGYSDEYEKEYIRKDGSIFPISIRVWLSRDKQGQPRGMWGLIRDITERKQIEEILKQSVKQYQTLGDTIPYGVWITDAEGYCTFASDSFLELM